MFDQNCSGPSKNAWGTLKHDLQKSTDPKNLPKTMFCDGFPSQIDENACQNLLGAADMLTAARGEHSATFPELEKYHE